MRSLYKGIGNRKVYLETFGHSLDQTDRQIWWKWSWLTTQKTAGKCRQIHTGGWKTRGEARDEQMSEPGWRVILKKKFNRTDKGRIQTYWADDSSMRGHKKWTGEQTGRTPVHKGTEMIRQRKRETDWWSTGKWLVNRPQVCRQVEWSQLAECPGQVCRMNRHRTWLWHLWSNFTLSVGKVLRCKQSKIKPWLWIISLKLLKS